MPESDTGVPHIARIYDDWLGGQDNFFNSAPTAMWGCVARKP